MNLVVAALHAGTVNMWLCAKEDEASKCHVAGKGETASSIRTGMYNVFQKELYNCQSLCKSIQKRCTVF
jgi:hypothetical protein